MTTNKKVLDFIQETQALCQPERIVWIDGSEEQLEALRKQAVEENILIKLNQEKLPGCYLHRTTVNDVARVEGRTFICSKVKEDSAPINNWMETHRLLWERGIQCDIVSPRADLSRYKLVFAPMLYLTDKPVIENLTAYVAQGGTLWATYMLGTVNETDLCWLGGIPAEELKDVFGIEAEEIDTLRRCCRQPAEVHWHEQLLQTFRCQERSGRGWQEFQQK